MRFLRQLNRRRLDARRQQRGDDRFLAAVAAFQARHPALPLGPQRDRPSVFVHSGHAGDVIYALPAARALADGKAFTLYLRAGVDAELAVPHPTGSVRLDDAMVGRLLPLMQAQSYIRQAARYEGQDVDTPLDLFRQSPVNTEKGNIARWYCALFAVSLDLSRPWLEVDPEPGIDDMVVLARSSRYRNPALDHRFLRTLPRLGFVGVASEYEEMRRVLPSLEFLQTNDFLQLARIIRGCRLFIGNQSAPFAIAEALKVRRILEVCDRLPNVIPEGIGGYEAWMQPQFEFLVKHCLDTAPAANG